MNNNMYLSHPNNGMPHLGHSLLPSRHKSPSHHTKRHSELTSSLRGGLGMQLRNSHTSSGSRLSKLATSLHTSNIIEGLVVSLLVTAGYPRTSYHRDVTKHTYHQLGRTARGHVSTIVGDLNEGSDRGELQNLYAEHIAPLVDLKWQLLGTDLTGEASVSGISLTQDVLDLVHMSPLQWEIVMNDVVVKAQDEITCNLKECITIGVGVCNALQHPLSYLIQAMSFYQDHQNGVNNYRLNTRLSIAGINKVDVQCSSRETNPSPPTICSELTNARHTWCYIPPIEITVDDC